MIHHNRGNRPLLPDEPQSQFAFHRFENRNSIRVGSLSRLAALRSVSFADSTLDYCPTCQTGGKPLADRRMSKLLR